MIWEDNLNFIGEHNAAAANGEHTYTVGMNQFGDLTTDEINKFFNGYNSSEQLRGEIVNFENVKDDGLPSTVDWVNEVSYFPKFFDEICFILNNYSKFLQQRHPYLVHKLYFAPLYA